MLPDESHQRRVRGGIEAYSGSKDVYVYFVMSGKRVRKLDIFL